MEENYQGVSFTRQRGLRIGLLLIALTAIGLNSLSSWATEAQEAESEVLLAQGVIACDEHRYDDALRLLTRSHELNPRDSRGLYYLGLTQMALRHPSEAVSALEAAKQLQSSDSSINYQLGVAYFTDGRYDYAHPLLEQAPFRRSPSLLLRWSSLTARFSMERR